MMVLPGRGVTDVDSTPAGELIGFRPTPPAIRRWAWDRGFSRGPSGHQSAHSTIPGATISRPGNRPSISTCACGTCRCPSGCARTRSPTGERPRRPRRLLRVEEVGDDHVGTGRKARDVLLHDRSAASAPGRRSGAGSPFWIRAIGSSKSRNERIAGSARMELGAKMSPGAEHRLLVVLEQRLAVRDDARVVVHVDDTGLGVDPLHDLVGVLRGRQPGTAVEVLRDAALRGEEAQRPDQEVAVLHREQLRLRRDGLDPVDRLPVDLVVVLAAEGVVVHPGDARLGRVDVARGGSVGGGHLVLPGCCSGRPGRTGRG